MKYYIMGYYDYLNAGDDAMMLGIVDELNRRGVEYECFMSGDSLKDVLECILKSDVVVIGGGTHLRNWGKSWLWQSLRIIALGVFTRLLNKQFHMWNVGIDGKGWEWIARRIANFISLRDRQTFDSAVLMDWQPKREKKKILGINLTPVSGIYQGNPFGDMAARTIVLKAVSEWANKNLDWVIRYISLNSHTKYTDDIFGGVEYFLDNNFEEWEYENPVKTLNLISECSAFIGMRYHACVFAYMAGVPCLAIKTYPSTNNFPCKAGLTPLNKFGQSFEIFMKNGYSQYMPIEEAKKLSREGIRTQ